MTGRHDAALILALTAGTALAGVSPGGVARPRFPGCRKARENAMAIDQVDRTVVTQESTADGPGIHENYQPPRDDAGSRRRGLARRIVVLVFGLIQIVIGARIVLLLLDAREANALVSAVLDISQVFVAPFEGILRTDAIHSAGSTLDVTAVVALVGWTILELIVLWVIGIFSRRSTARNRLTASRTPLRTGDPSALSAVRNAGRATRKGSSPMGIVAWIVLGAIAGFIANLIMGGGEGLIMMVVLGIVGAVVGGFIAGTVLGVADITGFNVSSLLVAVFGAVVVIFVARLFHVARREQGRLMADQHVKGAVSTAKGTVKEVAGKVDRRQGARGEGQGPEGPGQGPGRPGRRRGRRVASPPQLIPRESWDQPRHPCGRLLARLPCLDGALS